MSASNKNIFNLAIKRCNWSVTVSMRDMLKSFVSVMLQLMLLIMLKIMLMMSLVMLKMILMMLLMMIATWQRCLGGWSGFLPDSSSPELISSYLNLSLISSRYEDSQPLIHLPSHSTSHMISHLILSLISSHHVHMTAVRPYLGHINSSVEEISHSKGTWFVLGNESSIMIMIIQWLYNNMIWYNSKGTWFVLCIVSSISSLQ